MFITVKSGIIDDETYQENEVIGKETYDDDQVDVVDHRIMLSQIVDWHPKYKHHECCWIRLTDGDAVCALETADSVEKKIKKALITPATN